MNSWKNTTNLLGLMLFSHGLFIIKSATGCSNGEPSEWKMISAWVLDRSFVFLQEEKMSMYVYLYIDVAMVLLALVEILRITLIIIEKCKRH